MRTTVGPSTAAARSSSTGKVTMESRHFHAHRGPNFLAIAFMVGASMAPESCSIATNADNFARQVEACPPTQAKRVVAAFSPP